MHRILHVHMRRKSTVPSARLTDTPTANYLRLPHNPKRRHTSHTDGNTVRKPGNSFND